MALKFNINKANNTLVNRMTDGSGFSLTELQDCPQKPCSSDAQFPFSFPLN